MENNDYKSDVQKLFLEMFLGNAESFVRCQNIFNPENFDQKLKEAASFIKTYVDEYKVMPELDIVNKSCDVDFKDTSNVGEEHYDWDYC